MTQTRFDVIVVGAGILGVSSAYHIKKKSPSKSVLLIDRYSDVAQGNTARSNAMFRNTFTSSDNQILSDSSIDCYLDIEKSGQDVGLRKTGYLWLMSEDGLKKNAPHIKSMENNGIETKEYEQVELNSILPQLRTRFNDSDEEAAVMGLKDVEGAVFGPKCGRLDPSKLSRYYLSLFSRLGGEYAFDLNAESLLLEPNPKLGIDGEPFVWQESKIAGVKVSGKSNAEIYADTVVLAAGAWMNELLEPIGLDGHVKAKKRQLFTISAKGSEELESLLRVRGFNDLDFLPFTILPKSGCFVKAIPETSEFWVGCDDDLNRPYVDLPSRDLDDYKPEIDYYNNNIYRITKEYFPAFHEARDPRQMWAGLYSYNTLDYIPFVFKDEETGIIAVGGDSGSGIMKGDSLGRIAASVYSGEPEAELFGGKYYEVSKIGFTERNVEREEWVI